MLFFDNFSVPSLDESFTKNNICAIYYSLGYDFINECDQDIFRLITISGSTCNQLSAIKREMGVSSFQKQFCVNYVVAKLETCQLKPQLIYLLGGLCSPLTLINEVVMFKNSACQVR